MAAGHNQKTRVWIPAGPAMRLKQWARSPHLYSLRSARTPHQRSACTMVQIVLARIYLESCYRNGQASKGAASSLPMIAKVSRASTTEETETVERTGDFHRTITYGIATTRSRNRPYQANNATRQIEPKPHPPTSAAPADIPVPGRTHGRAGNPVARASQRPRQQP